MGTPRGPAAGRALRPGTHRGRGREQRVRFGWFCTLLLHIQSCCKKREVKMDGADLSLCSRTEGATQSCPGTGGGQAPSLLPPHGQQQAGKGRSLEGNPRSELREFPRGSRTVSRAGFEHGGGADPGSIDTDAMTTLTSSLLRTGAAGKGAARRSPPALLAPAVGLGALGLWGSGAGGSGVGVSGALGLWGLWVWGLWGFSRPHRAALPLCSPIPLAGTVSLPQHTGYLWGRCVTPLTHTMQPQSQGLPGAGCCPQLLLAFCCFVSLCSLWQVGTRI